MTEFNNPAARNRHAASASRVMLFDDSDEPINAPVSAITDLVPPEPQHPLAQKAQDFLAHISQDFELSTEEPVSGQAPEVRVLQSDAVAAAGDAFYTQAPLVLPHTVGSRQTLTFNFIISGVVAGTDYRLKITNQDGTLYHNYDTDATWYATPGHDGFYHIGRGTDDFHNVPLRHGQVVSLVQVNRTNIITLDSGVRVTVPDGSLTADKFVDGVIQPSQADAVSANAHGIATNSQSLSTLEHQVHEIVTSPSAGIDPTTRAHLETLSGWFHTVSVASAFLQLFDGAAYNLARAAWQADADIGTGAQVSPGPIKNGDTFSPTSDSALRDPASKGGFTYPMPEVVAPANASNRIHYGFATFGNLGATFLDIADGSLLPQPQSIFRLGGYTLIETTATGMRFLSGPAVGPVPGRPLVVAGHLRLYGSSRTDFEIDAPSNTTPVTANFDFSSDAHTGDVTVQFAGIGLDSGTDSFVVSIPDRDTLTSPQDETVTVSGVAVDVHVSYIPDDTAFGSNDIIQVTIDGETPSMLVRIEAQVDAHVPDEFQVPEVNQTFEQTGYMLPRSAAGFNGFIVEIDTEGATDVLRLTVAGGEIITQDLGVKFTSAELSNPQIMYSDFHGWVTEVVGWYSKGVHRISDGELKLYSRDWHFSSLSPVLSPAGQYTGFTVPSGYGGIGQFTEIDNVTDTWQLPAGFTMAIATSIEDSQGDNVNIVLNPHDLPKTDTVRRSSSFGRSGAFTILLDSSGSVTSSVSPTQIHSVVYI